MKVAMVCIVTLGFLAVAGCQSSPGGGMAKEETFKIVVPMMDQKIKQGETQMVTVSLNRGDYFRQDVKLEITAPKGISVDPAAITVKAGDKPDVPLRVTVPKDAALEKFKVYVRGTPGTGQPTSIDFTVQVVAP